MSQGLHTWALRFAVSWVEKQIYQMYKSSGAPLWIAFEGGARLLIREAAQHPLVSTQLPVKTKPHVWGMNEQPSVPPHALSSALKATFVGLGPFFLFVLIAKPADAIWREGRSSVVNGSCTFEAQRLWWLTLAC